MRIKRLMMFGLAFIILSCVLVSAQWYDFESASNQIIDWIIQIFGPFFEVLLGGDISYLLFEKILFFFILIALIFVILKKFSLFEYHLGALWVVTFSVSLLATRFLTETQLIKNILLPYGVLGVSLTAGIPLIIFFIFVHTFESGVLRKILWIFFVVVFAGLWGTRGEELGELAWIYLITGVLALIFLLADGTIRRILIKQQMKQLGFDRRQDFESEIRRQLWQTDQDLNRNIITPSQHSHIKRRLQKKLKAIRKN